MLKKICQYCKLEYEKDYRDSMNYFLNRRMFCSKKCADLSKKGKHFIPKNGFKKGQTAGNKNWNWKGGKHIGTQGYVVMTTAPNKTDLEHRVVMERYLGRKLNKGEQVHHINGIKTDNRIKNLQLVDWHEHGRVHALQRWHKKEVGII